MRRGHGEKLSRKQEQAIAALLTHGTIERAAAEVNVAASTLKRWLALPAFAAACKEASQRILERTITRLLAVSGKAVSTLEASLDCDDPSARNRAAIAILQNTFKGMEALARNGQPADTALLDLLYRNLPAHANATGAGGPR